MLKKLFIFNRFSLLLKRVVNTDDTPITKIVTLQLPDDLDRQLLLRANQLNLSLETLILQTLT